MDDHAVPDEAVQGELVDALVDIEAASKEATARNLAIARRARWLRKRLADDPRVRTALESEPRPLIVEMVTDNVRRWHDTGSRLRRVQAQALRREGLTMEDIADLFGVTRQRVWALLRPPAQSPDQPDGSQQG